MLSPYVLAHRQWGEGGVHPGFSQGAPKPGRRLQVARQRRPLGGGAGSRELFSAPGAESRHRRARSGRGAQAATLSRRRRSCSPRVSTTHSGAELFLASCRGASCLSHSIRREPPPPPSPGVNAHTSRRSSRRAGLAPPSRPRPCREAAGRARARVPDGPGRGQQAAHAQPLRARARGFAQRRQSALG